MMQDFIEVFNSRNSQTPYYAIVWRSCTVDGIARCARLANIIAYCTAHALPVVCKNDDMRRELLLCGIQARPFVTKMIQWQENEPLHLKSRVVGNQSHSAGYINGVQP
jgi:hypothetical protein